MLQQSIAIGPLGFSLHQLVFVMAFLMALMVGAILGRRHNVAVSDTLITVFFIAFIAARAVFVVRYWGAYDGIISRLDIRDGGFNLAGGMMAGLGYASWVLWRSSHQRWPLGGALLAGCLTWGIIVGSTALIEQQARPLPDTPLVDLSGQPTSLPQFANQTQQPIVVNLWASWCPPCIREMPVFEEAQNTEQGITFVFVNQGENAQHIEAFMSQHDLSLDNVWLDQRNALGKATGAHAMPTTLFYSAEGKLVNTHFGELSHATLQQGLERLR